MHIKILLMAGVILLTLAGCTWAFEINIDIIGEIESNNDALAYNPRTQARGAFQITPQCLTDFNDWNTDGVIYTKKDLFSILRGSVVCDWYINTRIPQLLKHYRIQDNIDNRLWAYNAGIGKVRKGTMPKETKNYIKKYHTIEEIKC